MPNITSILFLSSVLSTNVHAGVELEQQVKISDIGLHFDGQGLDFGNVTSPDSGSAYDYFFGRNISAHGDAVKAYKNYVFMTWYKGGKDERNVMLSRYNTLTGTIATIEFPHRHTGFRGDPLVGESHNTIGLAVSPINGTIHMVYDMHAYDDNNHGGKFKDDFFRYSFSEIGVADLPDEQFTLDKFVKDTSSVSQGPDDYKHLTMTGNLADKGNFARLTYPKFFTNTDGTLLLYMRLGGNNNGAYVFNRYDAQTEKWSSFTKFNNNNQKSFGNDYNWGLYGNMKYVNGKLRVGFQQRSSDNNDRYKYQNGVFYAYSDHADGVGEWKNHKGEVMTWPLVNSDEIKVLEPGDYISHQEANSVYIVGSFDWTVTKKGDVHFISKVRSTDKSRPDYEEIYLHSYKPAGATEFITTTDFVGASEIYTAGNNIYIIGLKDGRPYVEKAEGGTNDFTRVYEATDGLTFDHGTIHIKDGKVYYYLMERGVGNALPLYLQVIDLDIEAESHSPIVEFPSSTMNVEEGYNDLSFTVTAESPLVERVISKVDLYVDDVFIRSDIAAPFVWGHKNKPDELLGLSVGTHIFKAVATDSEGQSSTSTMQLVVNSKGPRVSFPQSDLSVKEGYEQLTFTLQAVSPVAGRSIDSVSLYINGELVREDTSAPFNFGHQLSPHETGAMGWLDSHGLNPSPLEVGIHTFTAVAVDTKGDEGIATMTLMVEGEAMPPIVTFPHEVVTVFDGYEKLGMTINAVSPDDERTIQSVTLYVNDKFVRTDTKPAWNFGHSFAPYELGAMGWLDQHQPNPSPLGVGNHIITAVAVDDQGLEGQASMTLIVEELPMPSISFIESDVRLGVGYESLSLSVNSESVADNIDIERVELYLNGVLVRDIWQPPFTWGAEDYETELLGLPAGKHTLKAVAVDSIGQSSSTEKQIIVKPTIVFVSSESTHYPATNVLDGDISDNSSWRAKHRGTESLIVDLGESKTITGTQLWTSMGKAIKYQVYISESIDGRFHKVAKHKDRHDNEQPSSTSFNKQGRFVKLKAIGKWPDITELNILFQ
ncbi:BNR-4 repeat-containing protein [Pseudoalteromonas sp. ZZD1]|uniref:BNR-4 repeat-containing protein n=1 Tax=Pseudoalteromonas sp. ZZD1 TaxID=3139395 RepID=UPI003BA977A7